jgi:hypothetical protein
LELSEHQAIAAGLNEPGTKEIALMEPLIFAIVAARKGYSQWETVVPEPAEFQPFDFRALKRSYHAEADSSSRRAARKNSLVTQIVS